MKEIASEAKLDALKAVKSLAQKKMAEDLKKVTVASDSTEGLKEGLEKAKEVLPESEESMEDPEKEAILEQLEALPIEKLKELLAQIA